MLGNRIEIRVSQRIIQSFLFQFLKSDIFNVSKTHKSFSQQVNIAFLHFCLAINFQWRIALNILPQEMPYNSLRCMSLSTKIMKLKVTTSHPILCREIHPKFHSLNIRNTHLNSADECTYCQHLVWKSSLLLREFKRQHSNKSWDTTGWTSTAMLWVGWDLCRNQLA